MSSHYTVDWKVRRKAEELKIAAFKMVVQNEIDALCKPILDNETDQYTTVCAVRGMPCEFDALTKIRADAEYNRVKNLFVEAVQEL